MASKLARKTASVFGGSLTAAPNGLNVFASFAQSGGTSATYSTDPAAIQSPQWLYGWDDALQGGLPVLEDMNSVDYVHSYQIAYLLQQGIAEYDAGTTYFTNSLCTSNGIIYISLIDSNIGNTPVSSPTDWKVVLQGVANFGGGTDTGSPNAVALTISQFPTNANILVGTQLSFVVGANNSNTGSSTIAINSQATIPLVDAFGNPIYPNVLFGGQLVTCIYDGTNFRIPSAGVYPPVSYKQTRWWALNGDANTGLAAIGIGGFSSSGTGSTFAGTLLSNGNPVGTLEVSNTANNQCFYTQTNKSFTCLSLLSFSCQMTPTSNSGGSSGAQSFAGYVSGTPAMGSADPLANLTGFGIFMDSTSTLHFIHNNGAANSVISSLGLFLTGTVVYKGVYTESSITHYFSNPQAISGGLANQTVTSTVQSPTVNTQVKVFFGIQCLNNASGNSFMQIYSADGQFGLYNI